MFMEPRNRFRGIDFASLCGLAGQYDKQGIVPVRQGENRYLVSLKDLQIRAQYDDNPICHTGLPGYIDWRNRFLDSINVYSTGSELYSIGQVGTNRQYSRKLEKQSIRLHYVSAESMPFPYTVKYMLPSNKNNTSVLRLHNIRQKIIQGEASNVDKLYRETSYNKSGFTSCPEEVFFDVHLTKKSVQFSVGRNTNLVGPGEVFFRFKGLKVLYTLYHVTKSTETVPEFYNNIWGQGTKLYCSSSSHPNTFFSVATVLVANLGG